ncbi:putative pectinesterase [Medicago truncatula]|uniref:pectinesterase n=1 Tax=Medicago truncatula TaxID=3880 RepID=A0A396JHJ8_MEDTR|nr:probable pectinesterase/pectinesterase inhibitor 42 [Medicago truncatula]RHN76624.1 putative pectinesterase [Medicago truncatula]
MDAAAVLVLGILFFKAFCSNGTINIIVSKDAGSGDYTSVGEAIRNAPDWSHQPYIVHVLAGIYEEYIFIPPSKINIKLLGHGSNHTILVAHQNGSTIDIRGEGFMAQNIGFVNTAELDASAAVAVRNEANNSIFFQCSIQGFQDTLWAVSGRQFYKNCEIYGTVDFIYGNAAAVFQDCMVYARYRQFVTFTAQSRESPYEKTGFTFQRCKFTMSPEDEKRKSEVHATLGRPWRAYSTVAILHCFIDSMVDPRGWEGMSGLATDKVTYVEFENVGPGSNTDGRVDWPGVTVLRNPNKALPFTASYLLDADSWIPSTGVPYHSGL